MAQRISKNNKRKYGLTPGHIAKLLPEPTEDAKIPMVQQDGSVKYVNEFDLQWMIDNEFIEGVKSFAPPTDQEPKQ